MPPKPQLTAMQSHKGPTKGGTANGRSARSCGTEQLATHNDATPSPPSGNPGPSSSPRETGTTPPMAKSYADDIGTTNKTSTATSHPRPRPEVTRTTASTKSRLVRQALPPSHSAPSRLTRQDANTDSDALRARRQQPHTTTSTIHGKAKQASASSTKSDIKPTQKASSLRQDRVTTSRSASSITGASASKPGPKQPSLRVSGNKSETKPTTSTSTSTSKVATTKASDSLQVAAQLYPWIYMNSSLEAAMSAADVAAKTAFTAREQELSEHEADIADQRIRFEIESALALYDELAKPEVLNMLPTLLANFVRLGVQSAKLAEDALQMASDDVNQVDLISPMAAYNNLLSTLEEAIQQAEYLRSSFLTLLQEYDALSPEQSVNTLYDPRVRIVAALRALVAVLESRYANLEVAREVVLASKENASIYLRVESLRLTTES